MHEPRTADPVELAIFQSAMHSIAEEMGAALRRTALSPNIKERRDYSCAVFDGQGASLPWAITCRSTSAPCPCRCRPRLRQSTLRPATSPSSTIPYAGGTHLPDITMVLPVFLPGRCPARLLCFQPCPSCRCGRNVCRIDGAGERNLSGGHSHSSGPHCARRTNRPRDARPDPAERAHAKERQGDLESQIGACRVGEQRILKLAEKYGERKAAGPD